MQTICLRRNSLSTPSWCLSVIPWHLLISSLKQMTKGAAGGEWQHGELPVERQQWEPSGVACVGSVEPVGALSLDMVFYVLFCHLLCGFEILSALILPCVIMVDYGMEGVYLTPHTSCIVYFHLMFCGKKYSLVESPAFCSKILANCILHMVLHNGNISELHLTHCVLLCYVFLR